MKKLLSLVLIACMLFAFAACGSKEDTPAGPADCAELLNAVLENMTEEFPLAGGSFVDNSSVENKAGNIDIEACKDFILYQIAFTEADYESIDSAAVVMHMMNQNTFTAFTIKMKDASKAQDIADAEADTLKANMWMCGFPDQYAEIQMGDYLTTVYGAEDLIKDFKEAFTKTYKDSKVLSEGEVLDF